MLAVEGVTPLEGAVLQCLEVALRQLSQRGHHVFAATDDGLQASADGGADTVRQHSRQFGQDGLVEVAQPRPLVFARVGDGDREL